MDTTHTIEQTANRQHLRQLISLRSLAIIGQLVTILYVHFAMEIILPLAPMLSIIGGLILLNLLSWRIVSWLGAISTPLLFAGMLCDVAALGAQVYLSGSAANPFISLFLLQVILGALMLPALYAWGLMLLTLACYVMLLTLTPSYSTLPLPPQLYRQGALVNYALAAVLSVWFLTRIKQTLKERDAHYAALQKHLAEEDHIVRMGLLASGAAHELGTPLSTLSVILNDWQDPALKVTEQQRKSDIALMQSELSRCKKIVTDILLSAGEVRGEGATSMPLKRFLDKTVEEWRASRQPAHLEYQYHPAGEHRIAFDQVMQHTLSNLLDNALESSPSWVGIAVRITGDTLHITVSDRGEGFSKDVLAQLGNPYISTKGTAGHGMGLFLVFNTIRRLSGRVEVRNLTPGSEVHVIIPLSMIEVSHG